MMLAVYHPSMSGSTTTFKSRRSSSSGLSSATLEIITASLSIIVTEPEQGDPLKNANESVALLGSSTEMACINLKGEKLGEKLELNASSVGCGMKLGRFAGVVKSAAVVRSIIKKK